MRSYIDLYFAPGDVRQLEIADRLRASTGLGFVRGPHDLAFDWSTVAEFRGMLDRVHAALRGTGAFYRVETVDEEPGFGPPVPWPAAPGPGRHPGFADDDPHPPASTGA